MENTGKERKQLKCGLWVLLQDYSGGKVWLQIWKPKAINAHANYTFPNKKAAYRYLKSAIKNFKSWQRMIKERKESRKATPEKLAAVKPGMVFVSTWGYEQTNVDFYQVVEIKKSMAVIRKISGATAESLSDMSENVVAIKDSFTDDEPMKKKINFSNNEPYFTINSFSWASLWDGRPKYASHYA